MRPAAFALLCTLASGCATLDGFAPAQSAAPEVRRLAGPEEPLAPSFGVVRSSDDQAVLDRRGNPVLYDLNP